MVYGKIYRYALFFSVLLHSSCGDLVNSRGKEFIVSFLPQHPQIPHNGTNRLYLSCVENTNVRVQVPYLAMDLTRPVTAGGMRIISLPGSARADGFTGMEKKGIRISSDKPFSVFGLQVLRYSGEGFLGLPTDFLGTEYMVPTYHPVINAIAQVVAREDNTLVSFHLRLPSGGRVQHGEMDYFNGNYINITLNELEIFHVLADSDLSGTRITSSKPIAVYSGNDCTMLQSSLCNHFVEQIPPISSWGTKFVTMPVTSSSAGDTYHVLVAMNNTLVHVDGRWKTVLPEGDRYIFSAVSNNSNVIATSNPSLVIHYHNDQSPDRSPFMALVPPVTWYSNDYTISVPDDENGNAFNSNADIVIDTRKRDGIRVRGGSTQKIAWEQIPSSGYSKTSLRFRRAGVFHVFHESPLVNFSLLFQGRASRKWFGFPAGFKLLRAISSCSTTVTKGGDEMDNDCDGRSDEELANGLDDDSDGRIDEDLATPIPILQIPKNISETPLVSCDSSSDVSNPTRTGYATGSALGVCKLRGKITISSHDKVGNVQNCIKDFDRVWELTDGCQNVIRKPQRIRIRRTQIPTIIFPDDLTMTCRESKYMQPSLTGEVQVTADSCPRGTTVSSSDAQSDCANSEGKLTRSWIAVDECGKKTTHVQIIRLIPNWGRQTNNYLVSFRLLNVQFSADLETPASALFKTMATNLDHEVKEIFLFSKFGRLFVAAHVVDFRNGSVVPRMLVKVDVLAKVDQRQLADFMNSSLRNGTLGGYQVDPSSVRIEDFDECLSPDMNNCHEKAICTNTLGSFHCKCQEGYYGNGTVCQTPPRIFYHEPAIQAGTDENVTLTCRASGIPTPEFKWETPQGTVNSTREIHEMEVLDDDSIRKREKILLDDGSLLLSNSRVHDQGLYKCVAFNLLGSDEKSINLTIRKDIVEVDASITIKNRKFEKELEDKTSQRYQKMKKEIEDELTPLFSDVEGFERVDILGFTNGSVKVKFRVVVKVDKAEDKKPEVIATKVGNKLKVSVEDGRVGNLAVEPTVELNEIPPPPVDVKASDITQTEAVITWSHPELHGMFGITGYKLQFKKFATDKWMTSATATGQEHMLNDLEHGTAYMVRLKSINDLGTGEPSENLEVLTLKKKNSATLVLAILLPILLLIILAIAAFFLYKRWKKRKMQEYQTREAVPLNPLTPEQAETSNGGFITFGSGRYASIPGANPDGATGIQIEASYTWREIPRDRVILGKILGEGEFGMVVKGEFTDDDGTKMPCAAKKLKRTATESDLKDLLNELEILTSVGNHPNLVNLIGACSIGGPLMVLVEFAENGNLLQHLRQHRTQNYEDMNEYTLDISSSDRLRIAHDVSNGMKHLAKMKCAHRDLAARNVLLGKGLVAKVSDFGLSRDIYRDDVYEKKTAGKLPAKWMAMEALEFGMNTSQSDVWSFGVLLWEIETGGCVPYPGMVLNELLSRLKEGQRLEKPRYSSDWLYSLMRRCWNANPKERPTFEDISVELHQMLTQETEYLTPEDYRLEPEYQNATVENASSA